MTYRFQSSDTAAACKTNEELREELVTKLIDRKLFGPSQQILDLDPGSLPLRELPPGTVASLYLMYMAWLRADDESKPPASKSTFYMTAKAWSKCLVFRAKSQHTICATCTSLKSAIHECTELPLAFDQQKF